jgi:signal transduction histidine kinase
MSKHQSQPAPEQEKIQFRFHPRAFTSLGPELVTNDVVAIIELVKNSYDALASRVDVRFVKPDAKSKPYLEIQDNGTGMTRAIIKDVWCVVATPFRMDNPVSKGIGGSRRVSGEKGLGRLSAARLGKRLEMFTKAADEPCWKVSVTWADLAKAESMEACNVFFSQCHEDQALKGRGTLLRILDLGTEWTQDKINDLKDQLSRLISPFTKVEDFKIWFTLPGGEYPEPAEIMAPEFLLHPPYSLQGIVDEAGDITCVYKAQENNRTVNIKESLWASSTRHDHTRSKKIKSIPKCGPFEFEIRAWDIDADSVQEISERFEMSRSTIRKDIKNYRGMSLYRDNILVLPKTDTGRDWLGLDLRRVSKVGTRLSTSQIVGYVAISSKHNKGIVDTSDRERLVDNRSSQDFTKLVKEVVKILEDERSRDRQGTNKEAPFKDLFAALSTKPLIARIGSFADSGGKIEDLLPLVEEYGVEVEDTVGKIEQRLIYYSRLASLGVLAAMLVHEVRNHTMTIGRLSRAVRKLVDSGSPGASPLAKDLGLAERGIQSLERLAERFAPLASRSFNSRRRDSILEDIIRDTVSMREQEIGSKKINIDYKGFSNTKVAIDPGELSAVIINLLDNAVHWLSYTKDRPRRIEFRIKVRSQAGRADVEVHDSGPGVKKNDEERIFYPGVTRKAEGLGMGLTVASEIIVQHGGDLHLRSGQGVLGGASFGFDVPLAEKPK